MEKMIAFCGLSCTDCNAYIATAHNDNALRVKTAEEWSKMYGGEIKPEDINCTGCLPTEGAQFGHCQECSIRLCGLEKAVANCGHCEEYACDQLNAFFAQVPEAKESLNRIKKERG